jgi:hypothetical protein
VAEREIVLNWMRTAVASPGKKVAIVVCPKRSLRIIAEDRRSFNVRGLRPACTVENFSPLIQILRTNERSTNCEHLQMQSLML